MCRCREAARGCWGWTIAERAVAEASGRWGSSSYWTWETLTEARLKAWVSAAALVAEPFDPHQVRAFFQAAADDLEPVDQLGLQVSDQL